MPEDQKIFISSSGDLSRHREELARGLNNWLARRGKLDLIAPYLWEDETEDGKMLSARRDIQSQLLDIFDERVLLTICMFGERCGLPLQDDLEGREERFAAWRSDGSGPGILHPWPTTLDAQNRALEAGAFPLTGTVFELFSAYARPADKGENGEHLIIGYVADRDVTDHVTTADIVFNRASEIKRLAPLERAPRDRQQALDEIYYPQVHALLNMLKFLNRKMTLVPRYDSAMEMAEGILESVTSWLGKRHEFSADGNPFKDSLDFWRIQDKNLPGRSVFVRDLLRRIENAQRSKRSCFLLLTGRSGCGKSSVLHSGLLRTLREKDYAVAAFRPADLADANGAHSLLDSLWALLCETVEGCWRPDVERAAPANKPAAMARQLASCLDKNDLKLALGLDQFEEILDDLTFFADEKDMPRGWWHVLSFIRHMLASPRFFLVGTLENQRVDTFKALEIDRFLDADAETSEVPDSTDVIEQVAREGFESGGLRLDDKLLSEIKKKWADFEKRQPNGRGTSSPLPLAALWLHRLYERFEYRAAAHQAGGKAVGALNRAASDDLNVITLEDLGGPEGVAFEGMIGELADEAWDAANGDRNSGDTDRGKPSKLTLDNFLTPFVGLDDGQIQLPATPRKTPLPDIDALIASFVARRLLVPAAADGSMVRLVHQSVIDRWPPASEWYEGRRSYLETRNDFQLLAKRWKTRGRSEDFLNGQVTEELVRQAALILDANRANWLSPTVTRTSDEETLRAFALSVFARAANPMELVPESGRRKRFVHVAATYGIREILERFLEIDEHCLEAETDVKETPLHFAAWSDNGVVAYLLEQRANPHAESTDQKALPIAFAIYTGAIGNFERLMDYHDLDKHDGRGSTMLCAAAYAGHEPIVSSLIRRADPTIKDVSERSPLFWAAWAGKSDVFRLLLPYGCIEVPDTDLNTPLHAAAVNGHASVIDSFLRAELEEATRYKVLAARNNRAMTPLMTAAYEKRPEALRLLLSSWTGPVAPNHASESGDTLLHLAVTVPIRWLGYKPEPQKDELVRARKVVEVLLADGRIDPNARNQAGQTAFDFGKDDYEDACQAIRYDDRVPQAYKNLTSAMRVADLSSRKSSVVLGLVRAAPQVLNDRHETKRGSKSGVEILLSNPVDDVVADILEAKLIPDQLMDKYFERMLDLAAREGASRRLCSILFEATVDRPDAGRNLPVFLDAALTNDDNMLLQRLKTLGCDSVASRGELKQTIFHRLAVRGNADRFRALATRIRLRQPLDEWNRRPSDMAPDASREAFRRLEAELFDAPDPFPPSPIAVSSLFHELAWWGNVTRFERLAQLAEITVPRDEEGRRPSDLASEEDRATFLELEERHFRKEN